MKAHVRLDAVELLDGVGRQHLARRALREHAAGAHQHERVAQRRREVQVVRRQHHRDAALAIEPRQQRRHLELIAEIERGRRLVEQQHVRRLRQRARDDDALLLTAAERHVRAVRQMRRAGGGQRAPRDRDVRGALRAGTRRGADAVPSAPSRARCSRRRDASPAGRPPCAARARVAESGRSARPSSAIAPSVRAQDARHQLQQRGLAAAVRAEQARQRAALHVTETSSSENERVASSRGRTK